MTEFHGKAYRYAYRVIGVCEHPALDGVFMIAYATRDEHKRVKALPLFEDADKAQAALDEFAKSRGLCEVWVCSA